MNHYLTINLWLPLLATVAYIMLGLLVMLLIDGFTSRITRFVWRKPWRAWLFLAAWPVLTFYVFAPRYRCRRGARQLIKPRPFVHS